MSKRSVSDAWFEDTRWFPLFVAKDRNLSLRARVVYSYLAHLDKQGRTTTAVEISRVTGVHRVATLPKVIAELAAFDLIEGDKPKAPPPDLFRSRDKGNPEHWSDSVMYLYFGIPTKDNPLSLPQGVLYWTLFNLSEDGQTYQLQSFRHLSNYTGISARVVSTSFDKLIEFRLIGELRSEDRTVVVFNRPQGPTEYFFRERPLADCPIVRGWRQGITEMESGPIAREYAAVEAFEREFGREPDRLEGHWLYNMVQDGFDIDSMMEVIRYSHKIPFDQMKHHYGKSRSENEANTNGGSTDHSRLLLYKFRRMFNSRFDI